MQKAERAVNEQQAGAATCDLALDLRGVLIERDAAALLEIIESGDDVGSIEVCAGSDEARNDAFGGIVFACDDRNVAFPKAVALEVRLAARYAVGGYPGAEPT